QKNFCLIPASLYLPHPRIGIEPVSAAQTEHMSAGILGLESRF
ncbi:unnamed protein product, partial [marine sediment metagenome]